MIPQTEAKKVRLRSPALGQRRVERMVQPRRDATAWRSSPDLVVASTGTMADRSRRDHPSMLQGVVDADIVRVITGSNKASSPKRRICSVIIVVAVPSRVEDAELAIANSYGLIITLRLVAEKRRSPSSFSVEERYRWRSVFSSEVEGEGDQREFSRFSTRTMMEPPFTKQMERSRYNTPQSSAWGISHATSYSGDE